jgi:hypothetical protein
VRIAAAAGWRAVVGVARQQVVPREAVLGPARAAARGAAPGISIRVAARHLPGLPMWTLRVTGRRGRKRASVSRGRGWYGRNNARQPRYSAARDQTLRHRRVIETLDQRLTRRAEVILRNEPDPAVIQERLAPTATRFAGAPSPRPLTGVSLDLTPDRGDLNAQRTRLTWRYALGPNMTRGSIRVAIVPTYTLGRTRDLTHYLVRTARPRINNLGPYELSARRITQTQRFVYAPDPAVWAAAAYEAERWRACREAVLYVPERRQWNTDQRRFVASPGEQALANRRARSMRNEVVNLSRADTRRGIVEQLMSYRDARAPRPLRSVSTEEGYGGRWLYLSTTGAMAGTVQRGAGRGHAVERHVLGTGEGIQDERDLARRAAFGEIVVRMRIVAAGGARNASAFASLRDANIALRAAAGEIRILWNDLRTALARRVLDLGNLAWDVTTPPVNAVKARRTQGGVFPAAQRPRYLRWRFVGARPAQAGTRPIHGGDVGSPEWTGWAARQPAGPGAPQPTAPLTDVTYHNATRAKLVLRPTSSAGASGWFVYTLYPAV